MTNDSLDTARRSGKPFAPWALIGSGIVTFTAAAIGSAATLPAVGGWYASLEKPWFTPPNGVFGPVWTVLYAFIALVLWQLWRIRPFAAAVADARRRALVAFGVQLVLNALWSVVFFGMQSPIGGLIVIVLLWTSIVVTWRRARPLVGRWADLFLPYIAWVSYAALLNGSIVVLALR